MLGDSAVVIAAARANYFANSAKSMDRHESTTSAPWARLIACALAERGIDAAALFRRAQMRPEELADPNSRFPVDRMLDFWALALAATQDPCFGLEVGRRWHPTTFHALGYAALASKTVREALERVVRYCHAVSSGVTVELIHRKDVTVRIGTNAEEDSMPTAAPVQAAIASIVTLCRTVRGGPVPLSRVAFRQSQPSSSICFEDFFSCPVLFEASANAIVFYNDELEVPLSTTNPDLIRCNEQLLRDYFAQTAGSTLSSRVQAEIVRAFPSGEVKQSAVARSLHVSLRSMQRKLSAEGTSFRELLDGSRRELAKRYLNNTNLAQSEIAYLLGFSQASSLSRAVARWGHVGSAH